jgi:hypothetical protein
MSIELNNTQLMPAILDDPRITQRFPFYSLFQLLSVNMHLRNSEINSEEVFIHCNFINTSQIELIQRVA